MTILDPITPAYYKVITLGMERVDDDVVARYHIAIYNVNGNLMTHINQGSVLTEQEKQAVRTIFQRDVEAFEAATGMEKWVEPEEP